MDMMTCDVLIIGAGPAGLTAGLYAARSRMNTVVVDKAGAGGYLNMITHLENYPGFPAGISGPQLAQLMAQQLKNYEVTVNVEEVTGLSARPPQGYAVTLASGVTWQAGAVIIATGSKPRLLSIPGEERLTGRGVSYCAVCDAPFFRGKDIVVVGGGNTALEEALYLADFCRTVTLVHRRDAFRADRILQERVSAHERIHCLMESVCTEIIGLDRVAAVRVQSGRQEPKEFVCQGVFVCIGMDPVTGFLPPELSRDDQGFLRTQENLACSLPGIFACGDCRSVSLRQVITACGEGALAAYQARKTLEHYP